MERMQWFNDQQGVIRDNKTEVDNWLFDLEKRQQEYINPFKAYDISKVIDDNIEEMMRESGSF